MPAPTTARVFHALSDARGRLLARDDATIGTQVQLTEIAAPTGEEARRGAWVSRRFRALGLAEVRVDGAGNVIGFHPEGTRNKSDDPYSYLRAQPGVGRLIREAQPQVIPIFIAGLCNSLPRQVARNWNREDVIRIHFGEVMDLSEHLTKPDRLRTHKEIADAVMGKIAELGERDRALHGLKTIHVDSNRQSLIGEREHRRSVAADRE